MSGEESDAVCCRDDVAMTIRAHCDGKVFVAVDRVDLPKDQLVEIDVRTISPGQPASPASILKLMDRMASMPREYVDDLEQSIAHAKLHNPRRVS
jgi:hypothetical protein